MEVILLQQIENLGGIGDKVRVKAGYARNYLLPAGRAVVANEENLAAFEARRAELEKEANEIRSSAESRKEAIEALSVTVTRKAGEEGKLFGSVGTADIVEAASDAGVVLERREIRMPDGPIHILGEFEIQVHLHTDVNATLRLTVAPES